MEKFLKALEAELKALGAENIEEALALYQKGENLRQRRNFPEAAEAYHEALELQEAPTFCIRFSQIMLELNKNPDAVMSAKKALELSEKLDHALLYSAACEQMAQALLAEEEVAKAGAFATEAMDVSAQVKDGPGQARAANLLGIIHTRSGHIDKALEVLNKALEANKDGKDNHALAATYGNLGSTHYFKGEPEKAVEWSEKALKLHEEMGERSFTGLDRYPLGLACERLNKLEAAKEHYEKALEIFVDLKMIPQEKEVRETLDDLIEEMK